MPPKVKKTCSQKLGVPPKRANKQYEIEEKENKGTNFDFRKSKRSDNVISNETKRGEKKKLFLSPSAQEPKLKSSGFWSKKLQGLEENQRKNKKYGLYEFSGTDESEASFKIKKKSKQKIKLKKKRQPTAPKYYTAVEKANIGKKLQQVSGGQQLTFSKEKVISEDKSKKLNKYPAAVQSLGITSTPAINADNKIGASNFLFLSPILKVEAEHCNVMKLSLQELKIVDGTPLTVHLNRETSKVETKLKRLSCRRVLRSGKMMDT